MAEETTTTTTQTTTPPPAVDAALAAKDAALKEANAKLAAAEKKESDRVKAEKAAALAAQQLDGDQAKKALAEKEAALNAANERLEALQKTALERADKQLAGLPADRQAAILKYKDAMPLEKFLEFVEDNVAASTTILTAPPTGSAGKGNQVSGGITVSAKAQEILGQMLGDHSEIVKRMEVVRERDEETGQVVSKFRQPIREFFGSMRKARVSHLTEDELHARKR